MWVLQDVGHAILESYSRVLESLASKIMTRIDDVLEADVLVHIHLMEEKERRLESDVEPEYEKTEKVVSAVTPNSTKLADLIGWRFSSDTEHSLTGDIELFQAEQEKEIMKSPIRIQPMKLSYLAKLENLRSPSERH